MKKVSLKDIAERVGVSITLVSYVLNNRFKDRINKEVAQKIRDTAEKLNYRPNQIAKSLKTKKTYTLGLVVADIANPFFSSLARIIEDEAEKYNYTVIFGSSDESAERSKKLIDVFLDHQVDGLIIAPAENDEPVIEKLRKTKIPFVLIDRYFPGLNVSYVVVNNFNATFQGISHLIDRGYSKIGMIGFKTKLVHLKERKVGYKAALKKGKIAFNKNWLKEVEVNEPNMGEVENAIHELLTQPEPVDAIFFASNKVSTAGLKYINTLSIHIPKDLAILTFDESDATEIFYSRLSHIRQPLLEMGTEAVNILFEKISNKKKIIQRVLQAQLVVGKSTPIKK